MNDTINETVASVPQIFGKIAAIQRDMKAVGKDSKNEQQKYRYRSVEAVYDAAHPLFARHGVFTTSTAIDVQRDSRTSAKGGTLNYTWFTARYTFWAEDGSSVATEVLGEGMDSGDKSSNKAMAAAHKYAICQILCIPYKNMEQPEFDPQQVTEMQFNALKLKWAKENETEIASLDRSARQSRFHEWCRSIVGESVDFNDLSKWNLDWYQACWKTLTGVSNDVPFEE